MINDSKIIDDSSDRMKSLIRELMFLGQFKVIDTVEPKDDIERTALTLKGYEPSKVGTHYVLYGRKA